MNPFGLAGPGFLGFYCLFAALVLGLAIIVRHRLGPAGRSQRRLTDPYAIALLRDGPAEAIRVAVLALVERKLLRRTGTRLESSAGAAGQVQDAAEQAIVSACRTPIEGWRLLTDHMACAGLEPRQRELRALGLAPTASLHLKHLVVALAGLGLLAAVGGAKILIALADGRHNVVVLVVATVVAAVVMGTLAAQRLWSTPRGHALLRELRELFGALRSHAVARRHDETVFLAAVFGISALPASEQALMRTTFKAPQESSSSSNCGSSSSCSSSGGSSGGSGGSSCGGGGCGGCGS
jgi:uncharacterized protein (TIGR04222 family)